MTDRLSVLQWNMGDSPYSRKPARPPQPRASALQSLLTEHSPQVVTLQEADPQALSLVDLRGYNIHRGPTGIVSLSKKGSFAQHKNVTVRERAQVVALDSLSGQLPSLWLINLHLPIRERTETDRRDLARTIFTDIDAIRIHNQTRREVWSGDLNFPPYDELVVSRSGLFANRDIAYASSHRGSVGKGLFNSAWAALGGATGALGTIYHDSLPNGPWQMPDQILFEPSLVRDFRLEVLILTRSGASEFATRTGRPCKTRASDHFPMLVVLHER